MSTHVTKGRGMNRAYGKAAVGAVLVWAVVSGLWAQESEVRFYGTSGEQKAAVRWDETANEMRLEGSPSSSGVQGSDLLLVPGPGDGATTEAGKVRIEGDWSGEGRGTMGGMIDDRFRFSVVKPASEYGAGKASIFAVRAGSPTDPSQGGASFSADGIDAAIRGANSGGNDYSAAVAAFTEPGTSGQTAALVAAQSNGWYGAYLAYQDAAQNWWSGYFNGAVCIDGAQTAGISMSMTNDLVFGKNLGTRWNIHNNQNNPDIPGRLFCVVPDDDNGNWIWENAMKIDRTTGNMALGKDPTDHKLDVGGSVKCTQVVIGEWVIEETQTPDYVFAEDYHLTPLPEVEKFVRKNKHLPDVPSAKEIHENGLDLVEMNMTLLKKVEELTLHAVEQNKRIEELSSKVQRLESERR